MKLLLSTSQHPCKLKLTHHLGGAISSKQFTMIKKILKTCFVGMIALGFMSLFTSCGDDASFDESTVENFVDQSVDYLHAEGNCGRFGCYEFVFPITIDFPDETSVTVDDYQGLRAELRAWHEANGDNIEWPERNDSLTYADIPWDQLPSLSFPLEVVDEDGEIITVEDRAELHELRRECRRDFLRHLRRHFQRPHRDICFKLVYPVSIEFPGGSVFTAASPQALKGALREWKENNPNADNRPQLVFPVNIEFADGSTAEVATKEALKTIKDECGDD